MEGPRFIYNLCRRPDWQAAEKLGRYEGTADDRRDGFIHFSTAAQVAESAARHRAGVTDLLLLAVEVSRLGPALRWEPSRGGQLFPHLYGTLQIADVKAVHDLPLDPAGRHIFSPLT